MKLASAPLVLHVTSANAQDRTQVGDLAADVQTAIGSARPIMSVQTVSEKGSVPPRLVLACDDRAISRLHVDKVLAGDKVEGPSPI